MSKTPPGAAPTQDDNTYQERRMANPESNWTKAAAVAGIAVLVLTTLGSTFAFGGRIAALEGRQTETESRATEDRQDRREIREWMRSIDQRLSRIEGAVGAGK